MGTAGTMTVRLLAIADVDEYLASMAAINAESGLDGSGHSHPYGRDEPFDIEARREREIRQWSTPLDQPEWARVWGLFDHDDLVGHLGLSGPAVRSGLHRARMGMGILSTHRRQGGGTLLLGAAIEWARTRPSIDWIDLGVFSDNPGARALYDRLGFTVQGSTPDRFRIYGVSVADTSMALDVSASN